MSQTLCSPMIDISVTIGIGGLRFVTPTCLYYVGFTIFFAKTMKTILVTFREEICRSYSQQYTVRMPISYVLPREKKQTVGLSETRSPPKWADSIKKSQTMFPGFHTEGESGDTVCCRDFTF